MGRFLTEPSLGDDRSPAQPIPSAVAPRQSRASASAALLAYYCLCVLILPAGQLAIRCLVNFPGTLRTGHLKLAENRTFKFCSNSVRRKVYNLYGFGALAR